MRKKDERSIENNQFPMADKIRKLKQHFSLGAITGYSKSLAKEKAKLKAKSQQLDRTLSSLKHMIKSYVDDVYYHDESNFVLTPEQILESEVDLSNAEAIELKPEVKAKIKTLYECYGLEAPDEYLTEDDLLERCRCEEANMMAGHGIL